MNDEDFGVRLARQVRHLVRGRQLTARHDAQHEEPDVRLSRILFVVKGKPRVGGLEHDCLDLLPGRAEIGIQLDLGAESLEVERVRRHRLAHGIRIPNGQNGSRQIEELHRPSVVFEPSHQPTAQVMIADRHVDVIALIYSPETAKQENPEIALLSLSPSSTISNSVGK